MYTYIQTDETGKILAYADWDFPGSEQVDYEVVRAWDGKLYKAGTAPAQPGKTVDEQIADVEAEYTEKLAALDAALLAALWAGGEDEVANRQALSAKRQQLTAAKDAAIMNILLTAQVIYMMQCPLCGDVPATCLTQENMSTNPSAQATLVRLGYWKCTKYNVLVKPNMIPDSIVAPETPIAEAA